MNNKMLWRGIVCALLAVLMLTGIGTATAEEKLYTGKVELYSQGALPKESYAPVSTFGVNSFEEYMIEQLNAQAQTIDVWDYQMTPDEFHAAYQQLLNSHPELFFVNGGYSYYASSYVTGILPEYVYTGAELKSMQAVYRSGVNAVVNYARGAKTDVGRMLRASDYMCANFEYDLSYSIYSPELFFQKGTGVCQAYMLAYRAVLNELGITNITVASDEINHTWNMVYLDGSWYHIDVTWNDPISDVPLRAYHTNFLLSDAGITATGHTGWDDGEETVVAATNKKYDSFFWINLNQVAAMQGDVVYYVDSDYTTTSRSIYAYDLSANSVKKVSTYDYGYGSYYMDYNPIWVQDETLYYAVRDSLYRVPMAGGTPELIYITGNSNQWIWYPYQSGTELQMYVANTPTSGGSVHSCELNLKTGLTLDRTILQMEIGEKAQLNAVIIPTPEDAFALTWSSTNEKIAAVDSAGRVSAVRTGAAQITVKYDDDMMATCIVIVNAKEKLSLPEDAMTIQSEAFANTAAGMIVLPDGIVTIGARAFADNEALMLVNLPSSVVSIAEDAFEGSSNVMLLCVTGSAGEAYAIAHKIPYELLP